jgi:cytochrome c5
MKTGGFKYVVLLVLLIGIAVGAIRMSMGVSARKQPGRVETFVARQLRHLAISRNAREARNPIVLTPQVLSEAMEHFADHCAVCHSNDGSGNTPIGKGLYPKPPDMRLAATQDLSDGELYAIIENGVRFTGMPAFGTEHTSDDQDSWKLVHFIRHLPQLTDDELARMKEWNPKSPADLKEEEEIRKFLEGNDSPPWKESHRHH